MIRGERSAPDLVAKIAQLLRELTDAPLEPLEAGGHGGQTSTQLNRRVRV